MKNVESKSPLLNRVGYWSLLSFIGAMIGGHFSPFTFAFQLFHLLKKSSSKEKCRYLRCLIYKKLEIDKKKKICMWHVSSTEDNSYTVLCLGCAGKLPWSWEWIFPGAVCAVGHQPQEHNHPHIQVCYTVCQPIVNINPLAAMGQICGLTVYQRPAKFLSSYKLLKLIITNALYIIKWFVWVMTFIIFLV